MKAIQWARKALKESGYEMIVEPQVVRSMPWSEVICFQTSHGAVYLKSMAKNFAYEPVLLAFLNHSNFSNLPNIIATNIESQCFLMHDAGQPLRQILKKNYDVILCGDALETYAKLQVDCIPLTGSLMQMGVMDCRLARLPELYEKFVLNKKFLLSEGLTTQEIEKLLNLRKTFVRLCKELGDYGIPETLEHGDFHDNNLLIKEGKITINDFGDAAITHPFFSIASFLNSSERHHHLNPIDEKYIVLRDRYLREWCAYAPGDKLIKAFNIAYLLRPFVWALSFMRIKSCEGIEKYPEYKDYLTESLKTLMNNMVEYDANEPTET